ncbi:MAG: hypothetical protein MR396_02080 [Phocaeicola sp.]|nr:hypothetical protein [Phocaeicola sp.]
MKTLIIALFMLCMFLPNYAQKLSDLPQKEREAYLIKKAKEIYKEKEWKEFYREFGEPEIQQVRMVIDTPKSINAYSDSKKGDIYYKVFFFYDENKEEMETEFAARVTIRDKDGKAVLIYLGSNIGVILTDKNGEVGR